MKCADCGRPAREMSDEALAEGSSVREPGEQLCTSCNSHRMLMVRKVEAMPDRLADLKAKRMPAIRRAG